MAGYQVKADFDIASVCFSAESIQGSVGAIAWCDAIIVRHIVASILEGGNKTRINPYRINAQPLQVIQFLNYPRDVPDAVPIGIVKALGINLVKDGLIEPGGIISLGIGIHRRESQWMLRIFIIKHRINATVNSMYCQSASCCTTIQQWFTGKKRYLIDKAERSLL